MPSEPAPVAIIGGGLGGLGLAIALKKHSIPFVIYEANSSFTEIGAGINLNVCTYNALKLIHQPLGDAVRKIATRNPPGKEDIWMTAYFGAGLRDGELIAELPSPPVGNMTCHRKELLALLADAAEPMHAEFNKKLVRLTENPTHVELSFSDGTSATANIVIGADGIHSTVRKALLPPNDPASIPTFTHTGVYRAVLPTSSLIPILGDSRARTGQVLLGPNGYIIYYPISNGEYINIGFWQRVHSSWKHDSWILPDQYNNALEAFKSWGPTAQKLLAIAPKDMSFWAAHHHGMPLEMYYNGRIVVIGDAAHSMTPHQGAGAGQAIEDAYVLAEVLGMLYDGNLSTSHTDNIIPSSHDRTKSKPDSNSTLDTNPKPNPFTHLSTIQKLLQSYSDTRLPRAQKVLETSHTAFDKWADFYRDDISEEEIGSFRKWMMGNFEWIWGDDIKNQGDRAKEVLGGSNDQRRKDGLRKGDGNQRSGW